MPNYEVNVSNIGNIPCETISSARNTYNEYVKQSKSGKGRAGGESVCIMKDGEPVQGFEYFPPNHGD